MSPKTDKCAVSGFSCYYWGGVGGKMYLHNCSLKLFPFYKNNMLIKKLGKAEKHKKGKSLTNTSVFICGWWGDTIRQRRETLGSRVNPVRTVAAQRALGDSQGEEVMESELGQTQGTGTKHWEYSVHLDLSCTDKMTYRSVQCLGSIYYKPQIIQKKTLHLEN